MRVTAIAVATAFLLVPLTASVQAHHSKPGQHQEFASAAKKKKAPKTKRKTGGQEQYLRAVPSR